ncbi:MAG: helix-turn-helix domain-containing protein [Flavisolibacter sp.]
MISGETLRQLRTLKGVKQKTVAKALGISQPAYCKLEHSEQVNDEKLVQVFLF